MVNVSPNCHAKRISRVKMMAMPDNEQICVLGIDPGLANLGLGIVNKNGKALEYRDSILVRTHAKTKQSKRIQTIYDKTKEFVVKYNPSVMAIEGQFFQGQKGVAFKVGQAVGACLLVAAEMNLEVYEYSPRQVKQALVGTGRADKAQVAFMVRAMLELKQTPKSHHVADALALALTHISAYRIQSLG